MRFVSGGALERDASPNIILFENLKLGLWHSTGDSEECRICGYRPQKSFCQRIMQVISKLVALPPYHCENCKYMNMQLGLVERVAHETSEDVAESGAGGSNI
jgi:hypothetical protein